MVQGYYTLPEAAQFLSMPPEELKQMAQKGQIRSFQDRGTWRFRIQDVQELARRRGSSSDPDLILGESPRTPTKPVSPRTPKRSPDPEVAGEEKVDIGSEILAGGSSGSGRPGHKSDPRRSPRSPSPGASDSDVRLVSEPAAGSDSDVKLVGHESDVVLRPGVGPRTPSAITPHKSVISPQPKKPGQPDSGQKRSPRPAQDQPPDSGVRLVPIDSDSDVKIVPAGSDEVPLGDQPPPSASDSDIRLEDTRMLSGQPRAEDSGMLTDEIDLDAEIRKQEKAKKAAQTMLKKKQGLQFPTSSPFELSESDVGGSGAKPLQAKGKGKPDSSSDFDLAAKKKGKKDSSSDSDSDLDLAPKKGSGDSDSDDFSLEMADDSALGGEAVSLKGPSSGISLGNPVDAGISLERSDSSSDFDLGEKPESTPKPSPMPSDSDSEFELSLDADDSSGQHPAKPGSDSEFELTLDDSGALAPLDDDEGGPQAKAGAGDKDIFETDFEVPALDEDSGSQVAALDTDLDSSDFDISLDDSATEADSDSQVVSLDEEADEGSATVATREGQAVAEVDEDFEGIDEEGAVAVAGGPVRDVVREKVLQPAPWGPLPVVFMLPTLAIMLVVGLLGFDLIQTSNGYKAPGPVTKAIAELMGQKLK